MIWGGRLVFLLYCLPALAGAQTLIAFSTATGDALPAPWRIVGLPKGKAPLANIDITALDGTRVLRLATDKSYGTALHEFSPTVPGPGTLLKWRWRLDQPIPLADLARKDADDAPLKVCAMFDMALDKLGFFERNILKIARSISGEKLPAATLCYLWDHRLPVGTQIPNAYSPRVRYVVMNAGEKQLKTWVTHERDITADFQKAFGHETQAMPPLIAIVVGADSDNTLGSSLSYVGDITLTMSPKPALPALPALPTSSAQ